MILIALTLLLSEPVHEESVRQMHHHNGPQHDNGQTGCSEPGEKPSQEPQASERLADNHKKSNDPWHPHVLGKEADGAVKPFTPEPPQQLLRAVGKHDESQSQTQDEPSPSVVGLKQCSHRPTSMCLDRTRQR